MDGAKNPSDVFPNMSSSQRRKVCLEDFNWWTDGRNERLRKNKKHIKTARVITNKFPEEIKRRFFSRHQTSFFLFFILCLLFPIIWKQTTKKSFQYVLLNDSFSNLINT